MAKVLTLHVKRIYFDEIESGVKLWEYRALTEYWRQRIEVAGPYDYIKIVCGYPPKNDKSKYLWFKWNGYNIFEITHEHFGPDPVNVYAINLRLRITKGINQ